MDVPLVVFVNTKSGGLQGTKLIEKFKKCIPPENVFDLSREGPLPGLQKYGGRRFRIIVCGGDGSVGWVLTEIEKLKLSKEMTPPVAILPIGTGNDLSRVLKWGGSHKGTKLKNFIAKIEKACVVLLDKWQLSYTSDVQLPHEHHSMHNYFSVGADASIALQFHEMRLAHPEKFSSRTQNLAWYVRLGLQNFSSDLLSPYVTVEINGSKVALPENTRCVVVLNLPSYSGGGNPWGTKKSRGKTYVSPTIDDGLLEVVAVNGPLQLVGIHANIIRGKRLGQGNEVKITMTKALPAQVDGEPWSQPPSIINIQLAGKSHMLANSLPTTSSSNPGAIGNPAESSLPATSLLRQPSVYGINRTMSRSLVRTRSSSAPMAHTPSPIKYGPIAPTKRRKGRLYCEGCNLEFYLPYMLVNHMNSGLCTSGSTKSENVVKLSSTPPATLSVQLGDGASTTDATSSHDSDDEGGGIWRTQSAEVSGLKLQHHKDSSEGPWTTAVEQAPVEAQPASPRNDAPASPHDAAPSHNDASLPPHNDTPAPPHDDASAPPHDDAPASPRDALPISEQTSSPSTSEPAPAHEPSPQLDATPVPTEPEHTPEDDTTHPVHEPTTIPNTTEGEEEQVHESGSPSTSQNFPPTHEEEGTAAEEQAEHS